MFVFVLRCIYKQKRKHNPTRNVNNLIAFDRDVENWIAQKRIMVFSNWPSQSPDLNPIEHLWSELKQRRGKPTNLHKLEKVLQEEWRKIPPETYTKLIESMPHRIEACIRNQGWPTPSILSAFFLFYVIRNKFSNDLPSRDNKII